MEHEQSLFGLWLWPSRQHWFFWSCWGVITWLKRIEFSHSDKLLFPKELQSLAMPAAPSLMKNPKSPLVDLVTCAVLDTLLRSQVGYLYHIPMIFFGIGTVWRWTTSYWAEEQPTCFLLHELVASEHLWATCRCDSRWNWHATVGSLIQVKGLKMACLHFSEFTPVLH